MSNTCNYCLLEIQSGACKCPHCRSSQNEPKSNPYQKWFEHWSFKSAKEIVTVLGWASAITASFAFFSTLRPYSNTAALDVSPNHSEWYVSLVNSGNKNSRVGSFEMQVNYPEGHDSGSSGHRNLVLFDLIGSPENIYIKPGDPLVFKIPFSLEDDEIPPVGSTCQLKIHVLEHGETAVGKHTFMRNCPKAWGPSGTMPKINYTLEK